jgi:hypothetical protein
MNKRIKKKLLRRLNIKHWKDAPNILIITDRNRYHKKQNDFMYAFHGHLLNPSEVDGINTVLSNTIMFYTGSILEEEKW